MDKKTVARHAFNFIGGVPSVVEYLDDSEKLRIELLSCSNTELEHTKVFSTIGLFETDLGLTSQNKSLRVELISIARDKDERWANIISSAAFDIMKKHDCQYGSIIQGVIKEYYDGNLEDVLLISPSYWTKYKVIEENDMFIAWLQLIPIAEKEREYILKNGIAPFLEIMEKARVDITDMERLPLI